MIDFLLRKDYSRDLGQGLCEREGSMESRGDGGDKKEKKRKELSEQKMLVFLFAFLFFTPLEGRALPEEQHPIPDGDHRDSRDIVGTDPCSRPWP